MKKTVYTLALIFFSAAAMAQKPVKQAVDSFAYYNDLFNELEDFLDSITAPRSFATINVGVSNGYFNYLSTSTTAGAVNASRELILAPSLGYFHKSGFGLNVIGSAINDNKTFNLYQVATTASYDYLQNRNFMTGVSYTHFFTKDSLNFYTSPLTNEVYSYFAYRKGWVKPAVAVSYGWGSRTNVEERQEKIKLLRGKPLNSTTIIETTESVYDLTVTASVKHDFYWLNVVTSKDYVRVTPQLSLMSGTQRFGLNQTSNFNAMNSKTGVNILQTTEKVNLTEESKFQPLSLSARIRTEFSKGKFFIQPQLMFDYYFPAKDNNLTTGFAINTGFIL